MGDAEKDFLLHLIKRLSAVYFADVLGFLFTQLNSLKKMYYTYVLQSKIDDQFYVGYTKDLKLRFAKHNKGHIESTKNRRPLKLIYYEACLTQQDALKREKFLKTWHGKQFLHKRLKSYLTG